MFNKIENIRDRKITGSFENLESLVNYVKNPSRPEVEDIIKAREFGKGSEEYKKIKTSSIPCATINFNHEGYVKSSTITNATGYMFLDIDDEDTMGYIDVNFVAAYWKSLSGKGFSLIVKVNGLNTENLKDSYRQVGDLLDIKYDTAAISKDRLTVLSYDTDAYFNTDYTEIQLEHKKETHFNTIKSTISIGYECNGSKIRYDNLGETIAALNISIDYDENGLFDFGTESKLWYSKIIVPFSKVKKGKRNMVLSSIIHQLIALNPNFQKKQLLTLIYYINKGIIDPPLPDNMVAYRFNYKHSQKDRLKPLLNASRRFLYNPCHNLSTKEKRKLTALKIGEGKIKKSKAKIREALLNWDYEEMGKITNRKMSGITGMNIKTINRYCSSIKKELEIM